MNAKLVSYQHVPTGFETLINVPGAEAGIIWNLWHNVQLSDDPEKWDDDIKALNLRQQDLGQLSIAHRLIRAHIAEFCRYYQSFPCSIDVLCKEIGTGCLSKGERLGCEGRRLLDILFIRKRPAQSEEAILSEYNCALNKWLNRQHPKCPADFKVFGFLGQMNKKKTSQASELLEVLASKDLSAAALRNFSEKKVRKAYGDALPQFRVFSCFGCLPREATAPACDCCWARFIDSYLLSVGASTSNELRRFTEEYILAYALALNSWLMKTRPVLVTGLIAPQYISKEIAIGINNRVNAALGKRNKTKEWLAGCLLKTLRSNQRWHPGKELIDGIPKATTWLGKHFSGK